MSVDSLEDVDACTGRGFKLALIALTDSESSDFGEDKNRDGLDVADLVGVVGLVGLADARDSIDLEVTGEEGPLEDFFGE